MSGDAGHSPGKIVCVLSGGGAKSAAHLGALRALFEWGLTPAHYVGTSMGAVIGACFASGMSYDEVLIRVAAVKRRDVASLSPLALLGTFAPNLLKGAPLRDTISSLVPARRFDELKVPLTVTSVDMASGELVLFGAAGRPDIPLVDALAASCALPVFYPPVSIGDRDYADGGLRAVLPLDVTRDLSPDLVFAVNVGPSLGRSEDEQSSLPGMVRAHTIATRILMAAQTADTLERWRNSPVPLILVAPEVDPRATFAVKSMTVFLEEGYRAAWRELTRWREAGGGKERRETGSGKREK